MIKENIMWYTIRKKQIFKKGEKNVNKELCSQNLCSQKPNISYLVWEEGNATAKDCAADSLGILWILVSAVKATPVKI